MVTGNPSPFNCTTRLLDDRTTPQLHNSTMARCTMHDSRHPRRPQMPAWIRALRGYHTNPHSARKRSIASPSQEPKNAHTSHAHWSRYRSKFLRRTLNRG
ncbi:hypothetical protein PLEOSDRAFT_1089081, partial [Pleurotus ostreatus PC15]